MLHGDPFFFVETLTAARSQGSVLSSSASSTKAGELDPWDPCDGGEEFWKITSWILASYVQSRYIQIYTIYCHLTCLYCMYLHVHMDRHTDRHTKWERKPSGILTLSEHDHRNRGFTQKDMVMFHSYVKVSQRVTLIKSHYINTMNKSLRYMLKSP